MRRRTFIQAGPIAVVRPTALLAGRVLVGSEQELRAAITIGHNFIEVVRPILLRAAIPIARNGVTIDLGGHYFIAGG